MRLNVLFQIRNSDPLLRKTRMWKRATDYIRKWIYEDTAFERLNPLE